MGGGGRRAGRGGRRDAAAARTSSESTSASSVFVSSGFASVYDSFSAGKCGRRNLSGLGTDVIDEVEVRTSSTIFSSAALRSSLTGSRTRSTRSSISFCSAWSSSESSATSPERVLIFVSAFVGFLEASSSFAFFGGEGGMADADLRNAERSASAVSASAACGAQIARRELVVATSRSSSIVAARIVAARSRKFAREPAKSRARMSGHAESSGVAGEEMSARDLRAMERSAAAIEGARLRKKGGGRAAARGAPVVPEASFWAEALPEDEAALFGAACELRLGGELLAACAAGEVEEVLELLRQPAADDREVVEHAGGRAGARRSSRRARGGHVAVLGRLLEFGATSSSPTSTGGRRCGGRAARTTRARRRCCSTPARSSPPTAPASRRSARRRARAATASSRCSSARVTKAEAAAKASPKASPPPKKSSPLSKSSSSKAKPPLHEVAVEASDEALEREAAALGHDDTAGALRRFREARGGGGASRPLLGKRCRVVEALGRPELKDRLGHAFEWDDEASRYRVRLDSRLMYAEVECDDGSPASKNGWAQAEAEEVALRPDQLAAASAADEAGAADGGGGAAPAATAATAAPARQPPAIDERGRDERGVPIWNRPPAFVLEEQMRDEKVTAAVARVNANGANGH